jgi:hypothetical protein
MSFIYGHVGDEDLSWHITGVPFFDFLFNAFFKVELNSLTKTFYPLL